MLADLPDALRRTGLRATQPRLAVLRAVGRHPHADAAAIISGAAAELPSVSRQAVYDCLNTLTEHGLVRRIQPAGSSARYELRTGDNHHHLVCRQCGTVVDVDCVTGSAPCLDAVEDHGFEINEAEVTYWGLCPTCAAEPTPTTKEKP